MRGSKAKAQRELRNLLLTLDRDIDILSERFRLREWRDPEGELVPSCTIITTSANDTLSPIHDRMPVILTRDLEDFWLDDSVTDPDALTSVLAPYDDGAMEAYEVSTLANYAANDVPEVMERVGRLS